MFIESPADHPATFVITLPDSWVGPTDALRSAFLRAFQQRAMGRYHISLTPVGEKFRVDSAQWRISGIKGNGRGTDYQEEPCQEKVTEVLRAADLLAE